MFSFSYGRRNVWPLFFSANNTVLPANIKMLSCLSDKYNG